MAILEFLLLSLISSLVYADNECFASYCGNHSFLIQFPFYLMSEIQEPQNCGYPGFNLTCTDEGLLILNLPHSGDFYVQNINYLTQEVLLHDPFGCLPNRVLNLDLNSSPFMDSYYQNYTFLGCPPEFKSRFNVLDCLSNSTMAVIVASSDVLGRAMNSCNIIKTVPVPREVNGDLLLSWNLPNCKNCEAQGGVCETGNNGNQNIQCSFVPAPGKGRPPGFLKAFGFIIFVPFVILPALFIGLLCCKCIVTREQNRVQANLRLSNITSSAAATFLEFNGVTRGLDESVIQSYPKVILDESRYIPRDVDLICPICLEDYLPGEVLRCIPDCQHYFHADCIDQWLRIKRSCPVCRTAPSDAVQNP